MWLLQFFFQKPQQQRWVLLFSPTEHWICICRLMILVKYDELKNSVFKSISSEDPYGVLAKRYFECSKEL